MKKAGGLSSDDLIRATKIVFTEFGLLQKIISNAGTNFIGYKFKQLCRNLNADQAITSSYHHQSDRQVEGCIKYVMHSIKNAFIIIIIFIYYCK